MLYTYDGNIETQVDTYTFWVNSSGTDFEDWGYGTEYLMVEKNKLIAGESWLIIMYKTLLNNTKITVDSPRNSRAPFSTMVSNNTGDILEFLLPSWCAIGEWVVTMYGEETLNDTFNVIAEEDNYCEFIDSSYKIGNPVDLYLRHNQRVKIVFYKDDIAYGDKYYFNETETPVGIFSLPDTSFFTPGLWSVQLWRTNDRREIDLMSEDNAYFEYGKTIIEDTPGVVFSLEAPYTYIMGTILTLVCLIAPAILIKSTNFQSEILKYVPLFSGVLGFIISCLIGFFPWYAIFALILVLVVILLVVYQSRKE